MIKTPFKTAISPLIAVNLLIAALVAGCSQPKAQYKPAWLISRSDVERYSLSLLVEPDADVRRMTIERLAETGHADDPKAVEALIRALRGDPSESVRCAAVCALRDVGGPSIAGEFLDVLAAGPSSNSPRAAGPKLRWELVYALRSPQCAGHSDVELHTRIRDRAIEILGSDPDRDVRMEAARLLGHYESRETLASLIKALRQADFGVVYEAGRSLERLTGKELPYEPGPWEQWLASTSDPFADKPAEDEPSKSRHSWWPFGGSSARR
ncbi:MAG: HEAT repeat domain-containing protein [Phycisphaerae bacterium]|nr:HEAT repeat domain-containing protein [Phycisphaerae bacterium]